MSDSITISCWRDLISELISEANDAFKNLMQDKSSGTASNFIRGELMGLRKALTLVKAYCPECGELMSMLDFDPDDRYM